MPKLSQDDAILQYMMHGYTLTPLEALEKFNCWALSSRISDLRKRGINIKSETETVNGKTYARYSINGVNASGA